MTLQLRWLALACLLAACAASDEPSNSADEGSSGGEACLADSPAAILRIENRTGNAIEVVTFVRCDGSDPSEFPIMPPGLASGEDVEIPLPGPGCWRLNYSGEGCVGDMDHETEMDVCAGATYVWTPDEQNHACEG